MEIKGITIYAAEGKKIAPVGSTRREDFGGAFTLLKGQTAADFIELAVEDLPPAEDSELAQAIQAKQAEIRAYDQSAAVNSFTYGGVTMWLTSRERLALKDRYNRDQAAGRELVPLTYGGVTVNLSPAAGLELLEQLNRYADLCFDRTQQHLQAVAALGSVEAVSGYDHTTGYPEKLTL